MISFSIGEYVVAPDIYHLVFFAFAIAFLVLWRTSAGKKHLVRREVATEHADKMRMLELSAQQAKDNEARTIAQHAEFKRDTESAEAKLKDDLKTAQTELRTLSEQLAAERARAGEKERAFEQERSSLNQLAKDMQDRFQAMADTALKSSQTQFLELADQQLAKHSEGAGGELKRLIQPIQETFGQFREKVDAIQKTSSEDRASMKEQFAALLENMQRTQAATDKLSSALTSPKSGGRWGEETLSNVLEMAGLSPYADFTEQSHTQTENGAIRPDVVVRLPGGRELVIDSKVSVDDYLRASEETDADKRAGLLKAHARKVRDHVSALAKKAYWAELSDAVDFVAMFIPGENFYAAALEHDRDIFDYAAKNKVIIVTPSTLIALAKAVAYGWRQEEAAKNAREVTALARELYKRLSVMGARVVKVGQGISGSASAYNDLVASLEGTVLPQARKFESMGMDADGKSLPELDFIEDTVREPRRDRDLQFVEENSAKQIDTNHS